jgi:ParB family chromosome partitioning protein
MRSAASPTPPAAEGDGPSPAVAKATAARGARAAVAPAYRRIAIDLVDVPDGRLAAVRPARVETIGKTSRVVGQLQAINVEASGGRYLLISGAKRLAALKAAGETEIDARVHAEGSLDPDRRRLMEIVENIDRQALTKLEFAEHLAELKTLHERMYPLKKNGGDRRSPAAIKARSDQKEIFSFRSEAAEQTGMSVRAIAIAVAIVAGLDEAAKLRIRGTWLEDHQNGLRALSEQEAERQHRALDMIFSSPPEAASVADALVLLDGGRLPTPAERMYAATLGNWSRMNDRQKADFLDLNEAAVRAHAAKRGWFR